MTDPDRRWTVDEFLAWDSHDEVKYELQDGVVVAMAPPSARHGRIQANVAALLHARLAAPCRVHVEYGLQVPGGAPTYYQADLAVVRDPLGEGTLGPPPTAVVEVVSPKGVARDRGVKVDAYRSIDRCEYIVLIHVETRRVEVWARQETAWRVEDVIGGQVEFAGVALTVEEIYDGLGP